MVIISLAFGRIPLTLSSVRSIWSCDLWVVSRVMSEVKWYQWPPCHITTTQDHTFKWVLSDQYLTDSAGDSSRGKNRYARFEFFFLSDNCLRVICLVFTWSIQKFVLSTSGAFELGRLGWISHSLISERVTCSVNQIAYNETKQIDGL